MKKIILLTTLLATTSSYADTLNVNAQLSRQACTLNQYCTLTGRHDIQIINDTDNDHGYSYTYILCDDNNKCATIGNNNLIVNAHTTFNNHGETALQAQFTTKGNHQIHNYTYIKGYESNQAQGNNIVMVNYKNGSKVNE